jgi:hypothetical protein
MSEDSTYPCICTYITYIYTPSGNQTWAVENPLEMEVSMGKSSISGGCSIATSIIYWRDWRVYI